MTAIDVGYGCDSLGDSVPSGFTLVEMANPANETGTIDYVCVYSDTLTGIKFASFVHEGSNVLSTNDNVSVADQSGIGLFEYTAPGDFTAFDINAGEYIGMYFSGGDNSRSLTGGSGLWYTPAADNIPASSVTFTVHATHRLAIYATGETIGGGSAMLPLFNGGLFNGLLGGGLIS